MKVIVTGDRTWTDAGLILAALQDVNPSCVVQRGVVGAEEIAAVLADRIGVQVVTMQGVGNQDVLDAHRDALCLVCFHDYLPNSTHTFDMVRRAKARLLPVSLYSHIGIETF